MPPLHECDSSQENRPDEFVDRWEFEPDSDESFGVDTADDTPWDVFIPDQEVEPEFDWNLYD